MSIENFLTIAMARSRDACRTLTAAGFQQVMNLEGGMVAWQQRGE